MTYREDRKTWRGNEIQRLGNGWVYAKDKTFVARDPNRSCGYCGLLNTSSGHDGCLEELPGALNACCGHGVAGDAYVQLDGLRLAGEDALRFFEKSGKGPGVARSTE